MFWDLTRSHEIYWNTTRSTETLQDQLRSHLSTEILPDLLRSHEIYQEPIGSTEIPPRSLYICRALRVGIMASSTFFRPWHPLLFEHLSGFLLNIWPPSMAPNFAHRSQTLKILRGCWYALSCEIVALICMLCLLLSGCDSNVPLQCPGFLGSIFLWLLFNLLVLTENFSGLIFAGAQLGFSPVIKIIISEVIIVSPISKTPKTSRLNTHTGTSQTRVASTLKVTVGHPELE